MGGWVGEGGGMADVVSCEVCVLSEWEEMVCSAGTRIENCPASPTADRSLHN